MRRSGPIPLLTACALLAACASPPDRAPAPSPEPPAAWTAAESTPAAAPEPWVEAFASPQLRELILEAFARNPDLEIAAARLDQAIAEARVAGADGLPEANLGLSGQRQKISTFGPQSIGGVRFDDYGLDLSVSWELDLWGRLRDRESAALGRAQASEADFAAARLSLAGRVAQAWFNLLEAEEQRQLARATAEADRENLRALENRFERGLGDGLDLRRIRAQAAASEAELSRRARTRDQLARSLNSLLGAYPETLDPVSRALPPLPPELPAGIPADILERRPDLAAAERRLAAAEKELGAARKERLPRISLTGAAGRSSQEFRDLADNDFSVWSLGANLAQPVFQGGRIAGSIQRAEALRTQAAAEYRRAALQAFLEVESGLAAEALLREEAERLAEAAAEAAAAEELAWVRYGKGTTAFLDALEASRTAASTRSQAIRLSNQLLQNRIDLYLALGGPVLETP